MQRRKPFVIGALFNAPPPNLKIILSTYFRFCLWVFIAVMCDTQASCADTATDIDLTSRTAWTFRPDGDTGPARTIDVPAGGWRLNGFPRATAGTYERRVLVPRLSGAESQVTELDFEAVNWEAIVRVGSDTAHLQLAGRHLSAWTPFRVDISRFVSPGRQAVIQVHVRDRTFFTDALGHFTVPAGPEWNDRAARGILRGVKLRVLPNVHIEDIFVCPSTRTRMLTYSATLTNAGVTPRRLTLTALLTSATGTAPLMDHRAGTTALAKNYPVLPERTITLAPGARRVVTIGPVKWPLATSTDWWPNIPYRSDYRASLHQLKVTVTTAGERGAIAHTLSARFGFCSMGQSGKQYTLNGVPINLRGDSLPEGTIGTDAFSRLPGFLPPTYNSLKRVSNGGWPAAVRNYQRLNYNVIRMHQIPCTRYMMDVCDELGMLVIPETAIRGGGTAPENITENPDSFVTHLRELIMRDRNHPSVVKWSLENELPHAPLPFLQRLYDACISADGSRPCSIDVFDRSAAPNWPNFAVIDHYTQPAGSEDPSGGVDRGAGIRGEGEYVWPYGAHPEGAIWFALETRAMRLHGNADLRPYTLIDVWPAVIPGLTPTNFPDPHLAPDSLEQGGRSLLNPASPWSHPALQLLQRSFAPLAVFDLDYDRANMHTNGLGDWPTSVPTLIGGTTTTRRLELFNDDLVGADIKLIVLPVLKLSDTDDQPLPETVRSVHIAPGTHIPIMIPLSAPLVSKCTTLQAIITLWKNGKERFRETLNFNVNPSGKGAATAVFAGTDLQTSGGWVDASGTRRYGKQAFMLPLRGGRTVYQEPNINLRRVAVMLPGDGNYNDLQDDSSDSEVAWSNEISTNDERVPWADPGRSARQPVAFSSQAHKMYFRVDCSDTTPHELSVYLLDYLRQKTSVDVDIYDTQGHRLESRKVDGSLIDHGIYVKYLVTGSIYVMVESLGVPEAAVSGLFVDPIP